MKQLLFMSVLTLAGTVGVFAFESSTCGAIGCGTVFELTPTTTSTWSEHVLHRFSGGTDGTQPYGSVAVDPLGNVFGTASGGGSGASGVIFEIKP